MIDWWNGIVHWAAVALAELLLGSGVIILHSLTLGGMVEVQYICVFCTSTLSVFIVSFKHYRAVSSPNTLERGKKKTFKGLCLINNSAKAII